MIHTILRRLGRTAYAAAALAGLFGMLLVPEPGWADATRDSQWHLKALGIDQAQQISQGEGVTVGLIDTGVDASHPDLAGSILPGIDLTKTSADGRTDVQGHGTSMAGLIAAHGVNGNGAWGIAPKAKILPIREASGHIVMPSNVIAGIRYAISQGVKVINISLGAGGSYDLEQAVNDAIAADIVVVAGSGNLPDMKTVIPPATYKGVLAVGGTNQSGEHEPTSTTGPEILISAPATDVMSTDPGGKYSAGTGTSNSTAIVSGVVALIRAKYPNLKATQVIDILTSTATSKGSGSHNDQYGYGIVNPVAALEKAGKTKASTTASPGSTDTSNSNDSSTTDENRKILIAGIALAVLACVAGLVTTLVVYQRRR